MFLSCVKGKHGPLSFSFLWDVLQAQKLIELEEMKGVDVQVEEEPEGEMLVGLVGEALRPPGMNTTASFLSFLMYLGSIPLCGNLFYIRSSLATR